MLVLSRKKGEVIRIGDDITINITRVSGDNVRVGVEAPGDVTIHRGEVYERIESEAIGSQSRDADSPPADGRQDPEAGIFESRDGDMDALPSSGDKAA